MLPPEPTQYKSYHHPIAVMIPPPELAAPDNPSQLAAASTGHYHDFLVTEHSLTALLRIT